MAPILIDKDGVSIYVQANEHLPPHIHAYYGSERAQIDIRSGKILNGYLPGKKLKVVQRWLAEDDNRVKVEESFFKLNPDLRIRNDKGKKSDE